MLAASESGAAQDANRRSGAGYPGRSSRREKSDRLYPRSLVSALGGLLPVRGRLQQITLAAGSSAAVGARVDLLRRRADAGDCDLVAKARISGDESGFLYVGSGLFARDRRKQPLLPAADLRSLADSGPPVTYTCVPLGSGERVGVDRDGDGDERDAHTDPADADSRP